MSTQGLDTAKREKEESHQFTLIIEGANLLDPDVLDALFEAGCDDASFGERDGLQYASFDRPSATLEEAMESAINAVEGSVPEARVVRVEPDELVSATIIAERTNRSRESIRLLVEGKRGPGKFPSPVAWVDAKTRLWRWSEVARWFTEILGEKISGAEDADFIAALNAALEMRARAPSLARSGSPLRLAGLLEAGLLAQTMGSSIELLKGSRKMADLSVRLLVAMAGKLLGLTAKHAASRFKDTPVERAIDTTQGVFPNVAVDVALYRWCQSDDFRGLLKEFSEGKRSPEYGEIVSSFVREGGFHMPEPAQERKLATEILNTFLAVLAEELYRSDDGVVFHARREEILHRETQQQLGSIAETQSAISGKVEGLPDELRLAIRDELGTAPEPTEAPVHARIDEARDLLLKGKAISAQEILEKVRDSLEGKQATSGLHFRIGTNLGACALDRGDYQRARTEFGRALQAEPDNIKALSNAAYGEVLAGDPARALKLARRAHSVDPLSTYAIGILIHALHAAGETDELDALVAERPTIEADAQCAAALGQVRLEQRRYEEAVQYLRTSISEDPVNAYVQVQCGVALVQGVQTSLRSDPPLNWRLPPDAEERLREADAALGTAIDLLETHEGQELQQDALANRAAVRSMLEEVDDALADCNRVLARNPEHQAALRNKGLLLVDNDPREAVLCLERIPEAERDIALVVALARAYGDMGEVDRARSVAETAWDSQAQQREQIQLAEVLVHSCWRLGDPDATQAIMESVVARWPSDPEVLWLVGRQRRREGKKDEASALLQEALAYANGNLRDRIALDLADLSFAIGEYAQAADLYKTLVDQTAATPVQERYVISLFNAGRLGDALSFARDLRGDGRPLPVISEVEALVLHRIGDLEKAKQLLLDLSDLEPQKEKHKLRAAWMAIERGASAEAKKILESISMQTIEDDAEGLMQMAHARLALALPNVLPVAYRARRLAFDDPAIHLAYVSAVLNREQTDNALLNPEAVGEDVAVRLGRGDAEHVYIIENDKPDKGRNELSSSDPLARKLIGARSGETVFIEEHDTNFEIKDIQSKYVFAFQDTLTRFPELFPENRDLRQIPVQDEDISKVLAMLDERSKYVERVMDAYKTNPLPLATVARLLGRSVVDVWIGLTAHPDQGMRVSSGLASDEERERAAISEAGSVVLDLPALLCINAMGMTDAVHERFEHVFVSQGVLDEINSKLSDYSGAVASGVMGKMGDQYFMQDIPPESIDQEKALLEELQAFVRTKGNVLPVTGLLELEPQKYQQLVESIGPSATSSLLLARDRDAVLFSDDLGLRLLAASEWNIQGTWSHPMTLDLVNKELITRDQYLESLRRMALWNYQFLSISGADLLGILKLNELAVESPTPQLVQSLLGPDYAEEHVLRVAAELVRGIWMEPILFDRKVLLLDLILAAMVRGRSTQILERLKAGLRWRLRLIPLAQEAIFEAIDLWVQQNSLRRGLRA